MKILKVHFVFSMDEDEGFRKVMADLRGHAVWLGGIVPTFPLYREPAYRNSPPSPSGLAPVPRREAEVRFIEAADFVASVDRFDYANNESPLYLCEERHKPILYFLRVGSNLPNLAKFELYTNARDIIKGVYSFAKQFRKLEERDAA